MEKRLRLVGTGFGVLSAVLLIVALVQPGGGRVATAGGKTVGGDLTCGVRVREKLISGAYKVYGLKDQPVSLWLAKTVFRNDTGGIVRDLRVRYRLGEYADWCSWEVYPQMVPTQTAVDLYHPILASACAKLTSRTPGELAIEYEYTDPGGQRRTVRKNERLTLLGRREFYFTDLKSDERTGSFQDFARNAPLLAAWVTASDAAVTGLAGLANERARGVGAATGEKACLGVMAELYEILRTIGITYQSPAHQVERDQTFDMMLIQTLQYPRDTIRKRSGTCIDLAMLYAAMMHSVGIRPLLVTLDGHCFPIGVTPGGSHVPVETTCVGGGGRDSLDFANAVKIARKQWTGLQKTGRFVVVDCQQCWSMGISCPELDPLPADILDRWKITDQVRRAGARTPTPPTVPNPGGNVPQPTPARLAGGNWGFTITQLDGSRLQGNAQVAVQNGQVRIVYVLAYQVTGYDGQPHQAREQNTFAGTLQGRQLVAQCRQAVWTLDAQPVQPQGLPYTVRLAVAADGRSAQGAVTNATGTAVQVVMRAN